MGGTPKNINNSSKDACKGKSFISNCKEMTLCELPLDIIKEAVKYILLTFE